MTEPKLTALPQRLEAVRNYGLAVVERDREVAQALYSLDIANLTPVQALVTLNE